MKTYVIKKRNKNKKIGKFNYEDEGYTFKPNIRSTNLIKISCLNLMDKEKASPILKKKLDNSFRRLAAIILSVLNDEDTTSGDCLIALDEIAKEKSIIRNKYKEYLEKAEQEKFLKRLKVLETEVKEKIVDLKIREQQKEEVFEKGRGR